MAEWSKLPQDLLELVTKCLQLADYHNFSRVCLSWQGVIEETCHVRFPSIVLSDDGQDSKTHAFFRLFDNKIGRVEAAELKGKRCIGSSHGWLVTMSEDMMSLHLLNPFKKVQIQLPPRSSFPYPNFIGSPHLPLNNIFIRKAVVSSDPYLSSDFHVMAIYGESCELAVYKNGDERWTLLEPSDKYCFYDIIYRNGHFYAVDCKGGIVVCHLGSYPITKQMRTVPLDDSFRSQYLGSPKIYLVDLSGDLLQVWRMFEYDDVELLDGSTNNGIDDDDADIMEHYKTICVKIFKLVRRKAGYVPRRKWEWVQVKSLGDYMLFLGTNSSFSLSARDFPFFKGNRIYFTDDNYLDAHLCPKGYHDYIVYNLEDGSIKPFLPSGITHSLWSPPIWIAPSHN